MVIQMVMIERPKIRKNPIDEIDEVDDKVEKKKQHI